MPAEQADTFLEHIRQSLETGRPKNTEYSLPIGNEEVWVAATVSPMNEGKVLSVARDVTDRKRAEEALSYSEERYRLVTRATNEAI